MTIGTRTFVRSFLLNGLLLLCGIKSFSQVSVTTNQTPAQMVNTLVGPGISTGLITGSLAPDGNGIFTNNGVNGFIMPAGIIMTTGNLDSTFLNAPASLHNSSAMSFPGDPDLDALATPDLSYDASVLTFDFTAGSDSVEFNFAFASEEYNEYVNAFNDLFAFFVTGPGYTPKTNVALIPGTTSVISINTVNNGWAMSTATGPCMNCTYYVDNVGTNAIDLSYDGFTTIINIKFPVWPCATYEFKVAIGDVNDGVFDSAVLLEQNSFIACPAMRAFQNNIEIADTVYICTGGSAILTAPAGPSYSWNTGATTQSITVTQPGTYEFIISDSATSCFAISDQISVVQTGTIQTPVISINGNTLYPFNLLPSPNFSYQWFLDGIAIPGATQSILNIFGPGCYTLIIYEGTCESISNEICTSVSIPEFSAEQFKIYPHPVSGTSLLKTPFHKGSVTKLDLYDMSGRHIRTQNHQGDELEISNSGLEKGVYLLRISNDQSSEVVHRTVIFM